MKKIILLLASAAVLFSCSSYSDERSEEILDSARVVAETDMDYRLSEELYKDVLGNSRNGLHQLAANVGLMKLAQIQSDNKDYISYSNDCGPLFDALKKHAGELTPHNDSLYRATIHEYESAEAIYYYNMRDYAKANALMKRLGVDTRNRQEFIDAYLGRETLYARSMHLVLEGVGLSAKGEYEEAIGKLGKALELVNQFHFEHNHQSADTHEKTEYSDSLVVYSDFCDSISTEMRWINDKTIVTIPEWMATIREQLSIVYGAMGMKAESDYNHNIYFDILDATRQDLILEAHKERLEQKAVRLNYFLFGLLVLIFLLFWATLTLYRRKSRKDKLLVRNLAEEIDAAMDSLQTEWMTQKASVFSQLEDELEEADSNRQEAEYKIEVNKRSYIDKATSVSIAMAIIPFIDRAIYQINATRTEQDSLLSFSKEYLTELIDKINQINDVLGHWVKIRQGSVSLNIESFALQPLFDMISQSRKIYDQKHISLDIQHTDVTVKADKALTLFMINTLMDNARKFTPEGGIITVSATEDSDYVEISVKDTGYGMSDDDQRDVVKAQKGHGFGLMNCKGIIEKYKKTNKLFSVCEFNVESKIGEGSRFYFRLPKAVRKSLSVILLFLSIPAFAEAETDHLALARSYADSVYFANANGEYELALEFADSVITSLNRHYTLKTGKTDRLLLLEGETTNLPEVELWKEGFDTDYGVLIDTRNELSIAALALNRRQLYYYNCTAFTRLYQLLSVDKTLEKQCQRLEHQNRNKSLFLYLTAGFVIIFLLVLFMIYYRRYTLRIFNLRQFLTFKSRLLATSSDTFLPVLRECVDDICPIEDVKIIMFTSSQTLYEHPEGAVVYPLTLELPSAEAPVRLGLLEIRPRLSRVTQKENDMLEKLAKFVTISLYCSSVKVEELSNRLEILQDDARRAEMEKNRIHVQNMILDNCLSTIKHETMYYPNRIASLLQQADTSYSDVSELIHYYRDVYSMLTECAMKQLERPPFRRTAIPVVSLLAYARNLASRYSNKCYDGLSMRVVQLPEDAKVEVVGDIIMLQYLLDTLISSSYDVKEAGVLSLDFEVAEEFCKFSLSDSRIKWTPEQQHELFYPDSLRYDEDSSRLRGYQYLVCRQIIREHDEHCGLRGCRIYAEGGNTIVFTLVKK